MKFNIQSSLQAAKRLFIRFPYTTSLIILEFLLLSVHAESDWISDSSKRNMIMFALEMGVFSLTMVTIAIQMFSERLNGTLKNKILMMGGATVLVAALTYFFNYKEIQSIDILNGSFTGNSYRMIILMGVSALSPFILPFIKDEGNTKWWNFTSTFISRGLVSALYSVVTFIGLTLALFALETFWEFKFSDQQYMIVAFFSYVLVAPLHLLNGLHKFEESEKLIVLPKFLSIFVKYILTPLIAVYTVILYPYIFSFPFKDEWPANEASFIILVLLALGYVGIGLFYGLNEKSEDWKFSRIYTKIFAGITLPTLVFWVYSLYLRIDAYGVTVNRFVMMAIILWFIGISSYYLLAKSTNVKYVTISFVTLLIVLFYLPFTAFYWSEKSQIKKLVENAKNEQIFKDEKIVVGDSPKNKSSNENMKETVVYLNKFHTLKNLKGYLSSEVTEKMDIDKNGYSPKFMDTYGEEGNIFFRNIPDYTTKRRLNIELSTQTVDVPAGYSKVESVSYSNYSEYVTGTSVSINGFIFNIDIDLKSEEFSLSLPSYAFDSKEDSNTYLVTDNSEIMRIKNDDALLIITDLSGTQENDEIIKIYSITGYLFTK